MKLEDLGLSALAEIDTRSAVVGAVLGGVATAVTTWLMVVRPLRRELDRANEEIAALWDTSTSSARRPMYDGPMTAPSVTSSMPSPMSPPSSLPTLRTPPPSSLAPMTLQEVTEPESVPMTVPASSRVKTRRLTTLQTGYYR